MSAAESWAASDTQPERIFNESMLALAGVLLFAYKPAGRVPGSTTFAIGGGAYGDADIADQALTGTNDTVNYVVAHRTTGAITAATTTTAWNDTATYGRVGKATFAANVLTYRDWRTSAGGIFAGGAATGAVDHIVLTVKAVANEYVPLITNAGFGGTITHVTSKAAAGTATAEVAINGTGIGSANSVSTSEQTQTQADTWAVGDDVGVTFTASSACAMANITIRFTR